MANNDTVKEKLLNQQNSNPVQGKTYPAKQDVNNLKKMLTDQSSEFNKYLNSPVLVEKLCRTIITIVKQSYSLQSCDYTSIVGAVMQGVALKLDFNPELRQAYIIPYRVKGKRVAQFQLGYKGYVELFSRSRHYKNIVSDVVYKGDKFKIIKGTNPSVIHEPKLNGGGSREIVGFYAIAFQTNGSYQVAYMSAEEMEEHARKYSEGYKKWLKDEQVDPSKEVGQTKQEQEKIDSGEYYSEVKTCPWVSDRVGMGRKTMIKQVSKNLPMPIEAERTPADLDYIRALIADGTVKSIVPGTGMDIFAMADEASVDENDFVSAASDRPGEQPPAGDTPLVKNTKSKGPKNPKENDVKETKLKPEESCKGCVLSGKYVDPEMKLYKSKECQKGENGKRCNEYETASKPNPTPASEPGVKEEPTKTEAKPKTEPVPETQATIILEPVGDKNLDEKDWK